MRLWKFGTALALLVTAPGASAQVAPAPVEDSEAIVVSARLAGAPMWEVRRGDSVVLLVGEITDVPKATPWRPERLEAATLRAKNVILGTKARVTLGVIFRAMWRSRTLTKLPKGKTSSDYLSPGQQARLEALERLYKDEYQDKSFLMTAFGLLHNRLKFTRDTMDDVDDIVRRTANRAKISVRPVGEVRGSDMLDSLLTADPATHVQCLDAAMTALEAGPGIVAARGDAWTRFDVRAVMASPLETALGSCWPWADGRFGPELRGQWVHEIDAALDKPGVTLAVAPLRVLAEDGGVLDRLDAQGLAIKGPVWRATAR